MTEREMLEKYAKEKGLKPYQVRDVLEERYDYGIKLGDCLSVVDRYSSENMIAKFQMKLDL